MVPRRFILASYSSHNYRARKGLWEPTAVSNQRNLSILQPQEKKKPFPKSKADNPVPRQLLVAF